MSKDLSKIEDTDRLTEQIAGLIESAKRHVIAQVNSTMTCTYYEIGHMLVEHEQGGEKRAEYGKGVLKEISQKLTERFGKGFSVDNLQNMRQFYLAYRTSIYETVSRKSISQKSETVSRKSADMPESSSLVMQILSEKFTLSGCFQDGNNH